MSLVPPGLSARCSLHDWKLLGSELAFVFDSPIPAGKADLAGEREREFSAWLVRKGWAAIESDGESAKAVRGRWLVCFGRKVTQRFSPDAHLLSLRILQGWPDGAPLFADGAITVLDAARYPGLERHARGLLKLAGRLGWDDDQGRDMRAAFHRRNQMDYLTYMEHQRHLQAWLVELARALVSEGRSIRVPQPTDPRLARALQVIDAQPPGAPYPRAELVRVGGLSGGRLDRLCLLTHGFSLHRHWERRRLMQARRALDVAAQPVKQVAFTLGFRQLSHFSAWFKRHTGLSPRAYRGQGKPV